MPVNRAGIINFEYDLAKKIIYFFFFFYCRIAFGQSVLIDSLKTDLASEQNDTSRLNILNELSWQYLGKGLYKDAEIHVENAIVLGEKLLISSNSNLTLTLKKCLALSYNTHGAIFYSRGEYDKAIRLFFQSLKLKEEMGDRKATASSLNNIGMIYNNKGDYDNALDFYLRALKIYEEVQNKKGFALTSNNIGSIYQLKGRFPVALEYHLKSLATRKEIGDKKGIGTSLNNIGNLYKLKGDSFIIKNIRDSFVYYYKIGVEYYYRSLEVKKEVGDLDGAALTHNNIGTIFLNMKKYKEAREQFLISMDLAMETGSKPMMMHNYLNMAQCDSSLGDYKSAYKNHRLFSFIKDSIFNKESDKQITEMSAKYDSEKKEKEIAILQKDREIQEVDLKRQKILSYSVTLGLALVAIISIIIMRSLKLTRKQKLIIENQKEIVEEKQKEIIDSITYARRIQHALLTSESYIRKNLNADFLLMFKPKDIVSGDFYWALRTNEKFYLMVADCTGHGVPGAFMSMLGINFLNEIVIERNIRQPGAIFDALREEIIKNLNPEDATEESKDGMDAVLCAYDFVNMKMEFAMANNPLWIIRKSTNGINESVSTLIEFKPDKMPIGKYGGLQKNFTNHIVSLEKRDTIFTFTDGYADQFGGLRGKKFMYKPFKDLLTGLADFPMDQQRTAIEKNFHDWKGSLDQIDDVCVAGVRIQ